MNLKITLEVRAMNRNQGINKVLYKDKSHLSKEGSTLVAPLVEKAVIKAISESK